MLCDLCGTDDARDPYDVYLANLDVNGPGYFQTYTFDHDRQSMVRFLDNANGVQEGDIGGAESVFDQLATVSTLFIWYIIYTLMDALVLSIHVSRCCKVHAIIVLETKSSTHHSHLSFIPLPHISYHILVP